MTPPPLGREALQRILSAEARVVIVNRSDASRQLRIAAAVIVRHASSGPTPQVLADLDLGGDESEWVDPPAPIAEPLAMLEVLLQLTLGAETVNAYLRATPPTGAPPEAGWEVGVRPLSTPSDPADMPIPELPGFAAYLVPFG
jgi:hypothetical protein